MLPRNIQPYFKSTLQNRNGENILIEGTLTCCGSNDFEVFVVGKVTHRMFSKMYLLPENDQIAIEVRCKKCGKVISVFDSNFAVYDQDTENQHTYNIVQNICCKKCQVNDFSVGIKYEYPDIQELKTLGIIKPDYAFTWIWITLACNNCGIKYRNFIDFEML